jgi:hypothetical protein
MAGRVVYVLCGIDSMVVAAPQDGTATDSCSPAQYHTTGPMTYAGLMIGLGHQCIGCAAHWQFKDLY